MLTMRQLITCTKNNQPQPKTLLRCLSCYFPKLQHFLLVWHVCSQARGTAWAKHLCKSFIWREEPISSNIFPQFLRITVSAMTSPADPVAVAVQVELDCAWSRPLGETHLLADRLSSCFPLNRLSENKSFLLAAPVSTAVPFKDLGWNTSGWNIQSKPSSS